MCYDYLVKLGNISIVKYDSKYYYSVQIPQSIV